MKLVIVTGQTATGKTKLAVALARKYNTELINCDSRQIYKFLDIITGKDKEELDDIPMHLYDVVDPKKTFSSYDWVNNCLEIINKLKAREKTPMIVGGTYFYLKHLLYGIQTTGVLADWNLRKSLAKASIADLQKRLKKLNPGRYLGLNQSDKNNPHRLIRKIEIELSKGPEPVPVNKLKMNFGNVKVIGLRYENKEDLARALKKRVEERLEMGAVEELKKLLERGYRLTDPGLSANACFEIAQFMEGKITREELVQKWVTIELQYAKRQYTFMKRDPNIKWKLV